MFLAIAALLLQFPAIPQSSPSAGDRYPAPSEAVLAWPQPSAAVALQPGRLEAEPVVPATPGAAAFIASTPTALRAKLEEPRRRRIWLGLGIAQHGAAAFDAWSTRRVVSSGQGRELNPMLRPFAGNASLYVAMQAGPLLLDYVSHRMMTSQHGWARHTWWMPQAMGMALSFASGVHNLSVH